MRTAEEIREEFTKLTGVTPDNSQGEPDIEYVWWLENRLREAECTLPVVSGSLPLASADKIMERIVPKYRDANSHDRAIIAGICDEVLDQSGRFLGEVRTRAVASNDR